MRLNDWRQDAERFADIDHDAMKRLDAERIGFCSRCHDHAVFYHDSETGEWLSECCTAREVPEDAPIWMTPEERRE
jgi:hypothetical protein